MIRVWGGRNWYLTHVSEIWHFYRLGNMRKTNLVILVLNYQCRKKHSAIAFLEKLIKNAIKYTLHLSDLWSFYTMLVNLHNFLSIQEEKLVKSKEKRWWYLLLHFYGFAKLKNEIWEEWFILQVIARCKPFVPLQVVIGFRPKFAKPLSHDTGRARCQNIVASSARHF